MPLTKETAKTVYLHIGFFKTGSTAIQNLLTINRKLLLDNNCFYPDLGSHDHFCIPARMAREINSPVPPRRLVAGCSGTSSELWERVLGEFDSSGADNLILSAETFVDFSFSEESSQLVSVVREWLSGFDVKIILYLREHIPYIRSLYQECVKTLGLTLCEDRFIQNQINGWHMNYGWTLNYWSEVFGRENIIVDRYRGGEYGEQGLFMDFLQKIGLKWSEEYKSPSREQSNPAIAREWVEAKRLSSLVKDNGVPSVASLKKLNASCGKVPEDSIKYINQKIATDVRHVNENFNIRTPLEITGVTCEDLDTSDLNYNAIYLRSILLLLGLYHIPRRPKSERTCSASLVRAREYIARLAELKSRLR